MRLAQVVKIVLVVAIVAYIVTLAFLFYNKPQKTTDTSVSVEKVLEPSRKVIDNLNKQEKQEVKRWKSRNTHYEKQDSIIFSSNDSSKFALLRSNIERYRYLLDSARRRYNQPSLQQTR